MAKVFSWAHIDRPAFASRREAPLDQTLEDVLVAFRVVLNQALASEPVGPAQTLRAFVRAACASAVQLPHAQKDKLRQLLREPLYQEIWTDYFDEACACDLVEEHTLAACRHTLKGLWQDFVLRGKGTAKHFLRTRDLLLSLAPTILPPGRHAPLPAPCTELHLLKTTRGWQS